MSIVFAISDQLLSWLFSSENHLEVMHNSWKLSVCCSEPMLWSLEDLMPLLGSGNKRLKL